MDTVKMTKQMKDAYERYLKSDTYNLCQAYKSHSYNKEKAWNYCVDLCKNYNGMNLKVVSHNQFMFSAGFTYSDNNDNYFVFITQYNDRQCKL